MHQSRRPALLGFTVLLSFAVSVAGQTPEVLKDRRLRVWEQMKPGSVMILRSLGTFGTFHTEAQDGNFFYLTGIDEPKAYLVLKKMPSQGVIPPPAKSADPENGKTVLFISPREENRADWDALPLGLEGAKGRSFPDVRPSAEFEDYFDGLMLSDIKILYMDIGRSRKVSEPFTADEQILRRAREKGANFDPVSPGEILTSMGRRRDASEIGSLRKAIDITAEAQVAAMQALRPGLFEYQLQAVVEYVFALNGSPRVAFPCIIGSGKNSCILHWMLNSKSMNAGEVVVVDIGAQVDYCSADITRTLPVSGKFTTRQRKVYEIVLAANQAAISMVAPGIDFAEISKKAAEVIGEGLVGLGLIKDKSEFSKYYFHGLGHTIGLRVGAAGALGVLEPGMVLTIEPGIYVREEGLGVRIEDDVLVTATGNEVLSRRAPKTIDEIERLMGEKGLDTAAHVLK
jgi:Xaa-Pro aminopeptidase